MPDATIQKFELPSTLESISKIEQLIEGICEFKTINQDCYGNMLISLTEAVNNAIIHGNKNDKTKFVHLELEALDEEVLFTIRDEGSGFDYKKVPDPTLPENRYKTSGRGIFLMRNLADKIVFEENGRIIKLTFCLT
ncbi:MAG: ATP-binding protein [Bacteroidetes bacterium HGW-Bacteroidetes-12]|nr:MAG: ATP-binding protein [Bacteroidetes bacterium HGW-Bacteroidetes-12]